MQQAFELIPEEEGEEKKRVNIVYVGHSFISNTAVVMHYCSTDTR
jgi:hypothetical protein